MAEAVGGLSGLTRKYLPVPQAADVGKYLKVDTNGNPVYYAETPGGVVTEAGANAANSIGADSGADIGTKLANVINNASGRLPTAAGKTAADAIGAATGATTALKLANLASPASETQQGVLAIASQSEATAGTNDTKAITPLKFAQALEAGQIITTTLAVDGGFAATNFGSTEAISGGTANG